jgi:hypothetical protein
MTRASEWWAGLGQRRLAAIAAVICALVIAIVIMTALIVSQSAPSALLPARGSDSWSSATRQAQDLLSQSPGFTDHLRSYGALAQSIDANLGILDRARQASGVIDELHQLNVPVAGNAWKLLVSSLNSASPGRGDALDSLDANLRQIAGFRGRLAALYGGDAVADAATQFRDNPSPNNLKALRDASAAYGSVLDSVAKDIQAPRVAITAAVERIDGIQQSLQKSQDALSRFPLLPSLVGRLSQTLSDLFDPLRSLQNDLDRLDAQTQVDLKTIAAIQSIVAAAERGR